MEKYELKMARQKLKDEIEKDNLNNYQIIKRLFELSPKENVDDQNRRDVIINVCNYLNDHLEEINKNENMILSMELIERLDNKEKVTDIESINIFRRIFVNQIEVSMLLEVMERLLIKNKVIFDYSKDIDTAQKELIFDFNCTTKEYSMISTSKIILSNNNFKIKFGTDFYTAFVRFLYFKYLSELYFMNDMKEYFWKNVSDLLKKIVEITEGIKIPEE